MRSSAFDSTYERYRRETDATPAAPVHGILRSVCTVGSITAVAERIKDDEIQGGPAWDIFEVDAWGEATELLGFVYETLDGAGYVPVQPSGQPLRSDSTSCVNLHAAVTILVHLSQAD